MINIPYTAEDQPGLFAYANDLMLTIINNPIQHTNLAIPRIAMEGVWGDAWTQFKEWLMLYWKHFLTFLRHQLTGVQFDRWAIIEIQRTVYRDLTKVKNNKFKLCCIPGYHQNNFKQILTELEVVLLLIKTISSRILKDDYHIYEDEMIKITDFIQHTAMGPRIDTEYPDVNLITEMTPKANFIPFYNTSLENLDWDPNAAVAVTSRVLNGMEASCHLDYVLNQVQVKVVATLREMQPLESPATDNGVQQLKLVNITLTQAARQVSDICFRLTKQILAMAKAMELSK